MPCLLELEKTCPDAHRCDDCTQNTDIQKKYFGIKEEGVGRFILLQTCVVAIAGFLILGICWVG